MYNQLGNAPEGFLFKQSCIYYIKTLAAGSKLTVHNKHHGKTGGLATEYLYIVLIGYFLGNINPSYILARIRGFDIRSRGSGNAGASNAVITMGKGAGLFSALFDIFKAAFSYILADALFPHIRISGILSSSSCIIGHIFPVFMRFHGGKGLACLGGMVLAFSPSVFIVMLTEELLIAVMLDYICIVPISGSVIFTAFYAFTVGDIPGTLILSAVSLVILVKHIQNLCRIQNGTEVHLSFLWRKDEELERVRSKSGQ